MSEYAEKVLRYYTAGRWPLSAVEKALAKEWLSQEEFEEIVASKREPEEGA